MMQATVDASLANKGPLPKKANLGCGYDIREGYLNVDLHERHGPDFVADVTNLPMLPSGHFEEIVAQDILEHLERHKTVPTLKEWARLLAPEGVIQIRVPSLFDLFEMLASPERRSISDTEETIHLLYGTQDYTGDYHLAGFTPGILNEYLSRAGLLISKAELLHGWLYVVEARKTEKLTDPLEIAHHVYFKMLHRAGDEGGVASIARKISKGNLNQESAERHLAESDEGRFLAQNPIYLRRYYDRLAKPTTERRTKLTDIFKR